MNWTWWYTPCNPEISAMGKGMQGFEKMGVILSDMGARLELCDAHSYSSVAVLKPMTKGYLLYRLQLNMGSQSRNLEAGTTRGWRTAALACSACFHV